MPALATSVYAMTPVNQGRLAPDAMPPPRLFRGWERRLSSPATPSTSSTRMG